MKTHTTNQDVVKIAKLGNKGFTAEEISNFMKIDLEKVNLTMKHKCGDAGKKQKAAERKAAAAEAKRIAAGKAAAKKAADEAVVDPLS